ncbi:MAG: endo alpha-1,4 polygalactosaminidase [Treponemataceae bacterium]|nr:endo alpha-1,4 polygalactosaminidase [Treponemataceae bacterium]
MKTFNKFILIFLIFASTLFFCACPSVTGLDYREEMRNFVIGISKYARSIDSDFIVIPQNGQEVAWDNDEDIGSKEPNSAYLSAINGVGREDTFYGLTSSYDASYTATPSSISDYLVSICSPYRSKGKTILSIDYCKDSSLIAESYAKNENVSFISFAAPDRQLRIIPENNSYDSAYYPYNANTDNVKKLSQAKNFLYLLNTENFSSPSALINAIKASDYDAIIMDAFNSDGELYSASQIASLKTKASGGKRLVIAYMSIGEAEDYRWYWKDSWVINGKKSIFAPSWLDDLNEDWEGNYKVKYWKSGWQKIIYGKDTSYLKKILDSGFDGVYLDIIDAYQYFEEE